MRTLLTVVAIAIGCVAFAAAVRIRPPEQPKIQAAKATDPDPDIGRAPEPLRHTVDVAVPHPTGRRINVNAGGNLQAAIDDAQPGDVIALDPAGEYRGPFRLPRKDGDGWIVITTAAASKLPRPGSRVGPEHTSLMPRLRGLGRFVITAAPGAHYYRLVGLDIAPADGAFVYALLQLGDDERSLDDMPHHIVVDRSVLRGDPARGSRRGVALNGADLAVVDSHLADFKEAGADSQAIAGWNGPGPYRIANNYLEGAGENVMFGGGDPGVRDLVPSDIEIVGNHLAKPRRWKAGDPGFEGTRWTIKNLLELKNARRVLIDGNLLEYNWPDAQNGFAILFTVRNQNGGAPWSVVEDVVFANNLVWHVGAGINILGRDDNHASQQAARIAIRHNLFLDVGGAWGSGRLFQLLDGTRDVTIRRNTAVHSGSLVFGGDHAPHAGFVFEGNLAFHNGQGITGSGTASGPDTLQRYFPGAMVRGNAIVGGDAAAYPAENTTPPSLDGAGVIRDRDGRYRLARPTCSETRRGNDCVAGADVDAIVRAIGPLASRPAVERTGPDDDHAGAGAWFVGAGALLGYIYFGYPAMLACRPRRRIAMGKSGWTPRVSIVVVAHNEEAHIAARIENLQGLDYPPDRCEILVGSDGSRDHTVRLARRFISNRVHVQAFRQRRGKPAVLNELVACASGEIVVFADARQSFATDALRRLVAPFADPSVGGVSGELMIAEVPGSTAAARGTGFYWRYEKFIRSRESRSTSTVGATGAIYAIRRPLFEPVPEDTILDDVLIPMRIVRRGFLVVLERGARAFDQAASTAMHEYARKVRTIAGTFQLFARERWLLNPWANPLWFETVSHKGLRLLLPILHATLFVANALLATAAALFQVTFAAQVAFYAAAILGWLWRRTGRRPVVVAIPLAMCLLLGATAAGFLRFITGRQRVTWDRVAPTAWMRS
jgi:biofilm PGA synthesis N-glycosyltransferase PgaC